jgi:hypothetical protein
MQRSGSDSALGWIQPGRCNDLASHRSRHFETKVFLERSLGLFARHESAKARPTAVAIHDEVRRLKENSVVFTFDPANAGPVTIAIFLTPART